MKYIIDHPSWQEACNGIACAFCTLADEENGTCKIREYIQKQPKSPQWIPCSERLPEEDDVKNVLVSVNKRYALYDVILLPSKSVKTEYKMGHIDAWMPLPEPYREEASE